MTGNAATPRRLWDVSPPLQPGGPVFPGDALFDLRWTARLPADGPVNLSTLTLSPHTGVHSDAPLHYGADGTAVGAMDLAPSRVTMSCRRTPTMRLR